MVAKTARSTPPCRAEDARARWGRPGGASGEGDPSEAAYVPHRSFEHPSAEAELFGAEAVRRELPVWRVGFESLGGTAAGATSGGLKLSRQEEAGQFLRYNYARYRLAKLLAVPAEDRCPADSGALRLWRRRARELRSFLVQANLPLVLTMIGRFGCEHVEFADLVSEGSVVLLRCVDSFDVSRGFKFSTYACRAILKSFGRLASQVQRYRRLFPVEFDSAMEPSDQDVNRHETETEVSVELLREVLVHNRAALRQIEQTVVTERFGIVAGGRKTLAEIAAIVGLSVERVRQIQNVALRRIRRAWEEAYRGV